MENGKPGLFQVMIILQVNAEGGIALCLKTELFIDLDHITLSSLLVVMEEHIFFPATSAPTSQVTEMQWLFEPVFRVKYVRTRSLANECRIWSLFNFIQLAFMVPVV